MIISDISNQNVVFLRCLKYYYNIFKNSSQPYLQILITVTIIQFLNARMTLISPLTHIQNSLTNLALNGAPLVAIIVLLLIINQIFLHLLLVKAQHRIKRKFIIRVLKTLLLRQLIQQVMNDWKTFRNTKINAKKQITLEVMQLKKQEKKIRKSVSFVQSQNKQLVFDANSAPITLTHIPQERNQDAMETVSHNQA